MSTPLATTPTDALLPAHTVRIPFRYLPVAITNADGWPVLVNPFNKEHGAPTDENRHVGDLGNFTTDANGNSKGSVEDKFIKLIGAESVIGVSIRCVPTGAMLSSLLSAPSSCIPAPMILGREDILIRRRLAMLADARLAVSLMDLLPSGLVLTLLGVIGIAA